MCWPTAISGATAFSTARCRPKSRSRPWPKSRSPCRRRRAKVTGERGEELKRRLRTGTVVTYDDRNWELRWSQERRQINLSRAIAVDMESGTIAAQGYRLRVPYGTLLCVSDKPLHGEIKLPGAANAFYERAVERASDDRPRRARHPAGAARIAPFAQAPQLRRTAVPVSCSSMSRENLGLLLGFVGVCMFAGTLPFTHIAVEHLSPLFVTAGRAALAGLLALRNAAHPAQALAVAAAGGHHGARRPLSRRGLSGFHGARHARAFRPPMAAWCSGSCRSPPPPSAP